MMFGCQLPLEASVLDKLARNWHFLKQLLGHKAADKAQVHSAGRAEAELLVAWLAKAVAIWALVDRDAIWDLHADGALQELFNGRLGHAAIFRLSSHLAAGLK